MLQRPGEDRGHRGRAVANFRAAGASCLVVSGYIDSRRGIHTEYLTQAALTVLRMRCDQPELRRRRGGEIGRSWSS
jgi:hypothetical protein